MHYLHKKLSQNLEYHLLSIINTEQEINKVTSQHEAAAQLLQRSKQSSLLRGYDKRSGIVQKLVTRKEAKCCTCASTLPTSKMYMSNHVVFPSLTGLWQSRPTKEGKLLLKSLVYAILYMLHFFNRDMILL